MTYQIIITEQTAANIVIDNNTSNVSVTTTEYPITIEYNATNLGNAYGNANVATFLAGFGSNTVSTTGNITGGYFAGNGSQLTGIVAISSYGNANVVANLASLGTNPVSTTGNISAGYFAGNGSQLTGIVATSTYGNANVVANLAALGSNPVSTTGNITGSYILGNGSQLTGLPATYGNANVAANLAAFGSNPISTSGNITGNYFLGNGSQLTGLPVQPGTYGNSNVVANLAALGSNPVSTTGNISSGNLNVGADAVITGNLTVQGTTTTVNSNTVTINDKFINVANNASTAAAANGGGLGVGPVGTEYATLTYNSTANAWNTNIPLSVSGNITGSYVLGNASALTAITGANVTGTVANATYATSAGSATTATTATFAGTANAVAGANVSGTVANATYALNSNAATYANVATFAGTANAVAGANVSGTVANATYATTAGSATTATTATTANAVAGANVSGTVANATYATTAGSATTATTAGTVTTAAQANITSVGTLTSLTSSGNITSGQSTIIGTANTTGGVGNIILSGKNIATDMIRNPDSGTTTTVDASRIIIGTGYNGNTSAGILYNTTSAARLWVADAYSRGNNALAARAIVSTDFVTLTANVTNASWRVNGITIQPTIGGGPAGNTVNVGPFGITGILSFPAIGGGLTGNLTALGNTTAQYVAGIYGGTQVNQGSNIGNAYGIVSFTSHTGGGGVSSFANSVLGFTNYSVSNVTPTTYISYHHPSNVATSYGISLTNQVRAATNYYFLKNDDAVAQAQLGSLRSYSEFNYTNTVTSGAVTIDKTNGQVQQVNLTGNVSGLTYSGFVSSASDGTNTDEQADTVTIIFNQGATGGYGVTFPSGSTYKYASGTNSLAATTANSVTLVSITAIRISGTTTYLTTISPAFT